MVVNTTNGRSRHTGLSKIQSRCFKRQEAVVCVPDLSAVYENNREA